MDSGEHRFVCSLPGAPALEALISEAFLSSQRKHRWVKAEGGSVDIAWIPYSRLRWNAAAGESTASWVGPDGRSGTALCTSSHPVRTALVSKAGLANTLLRARAAANRALEQGLFHDGDVGTKAALQALVQCALPYTIIDLRPEAAQSLLAQVRCALAESPPNPRVQTMRMWVLKEPLANNGLGVHFVADKDVAKLVAQIASRASEDVEEEEEGTKQGIALTRTPHTLLLQAHADNPLLFDGLYKFHIRLNIMVMGSESCKPAVYVHSEPVVHVACEPLLVPTLTHPTPGLGGGYSLSPASSTFAHVTNNVVQRRHPLYTPEGKTMLLADAARRFTLPSSSPVVGREAARSPDSAALMSRMEGIVASLIVFLTTASAFPAHGLECHENAGTTHDNATLAASLRCAITAAVADWPSDRALGFVTHPNSFELFGLDFLVTASESDSVGEACMDGSSPGGEAWWRCVLLEVNGGPALESRAWPELARRVVEDAVGCVADLYFPSLVREGRGERPEVVETGWRVPYGNGFKRVM